MIQIGPYSLDPAEPLTLAALIGGGALLLILLLLLLALRAAARTARMTEPLAWQMTHLGERVQGLSDGQHQLAGGLNHVSEAQASAQAHMLQLMEKRLAQVTENMSENLQGSARRTAQSLGELHQRLQAIDKAQDNITKLSGDVLSLQDILSNKQTRGAFGEIQLTDIEWQARRLPDPPAEPARPHLHRQQVPAGGLRGAAPGHHRCGGDRGRAIPA